MVVILLTVAATVLLVLLAIGKVPISYTVRNLTVRWRTTALTALAFTLVISLLTVMLAFVNGMVRLTEGTGQPGNVLILADGSTDEAFSNLSSTDLSDIENESAVVRVLHHQTRGYVDITPETARDPDLVSQRSIPLASRETYLVVNQPIPNAAPGGPQRRFLQLRGQEDAMLAARVHGLDLLPGGSWPSEAGVQDVTADGQSGTGPFFGGKTSFAGRRLAENMDLSPSAAEGAETAIEALLGEGVARELARDRTPQEIDSARNRERLDVGDTFRLGDRTWIVVGMLQSTGSTFNSEVWAKRSLVAELFGKKTYSSMVVRTRSAQAAKDFCKFLKEKYAKAAVAAQPETDYYASLSETNQQFTFAIAFVTVVMSIGGVLGVMNTMFAAVSSRIKDIGVLRLLGYTRRHILVSLLLESLLIALAGGLLGCALGAMSDGWSATSVVAGAGMGKSVTLRLVVDAHIVSVGILMTLVMGGLGGALPALSAMRLSALEALR